MSNSQKCPECRSILEKVDNMLRCKGYCDFEIEIGAEEANLLDVANLPQSNSLPQINALNAPQNSNAPIVAAPTAITHQFTVKLADVVPKDNTVNVGQQPNNAQQPDSTGGDDVNAATKSDTKKYKIQIFEEGIQRLLALFGGKDPAICILSVCGTSASGKTTWINNLLRALYPQHGASLDESPCEGLRALCCPLYFAGEQHALIILECEGVDSQRVVTKNAAFARQLRILNLIALAVADSAYVMTQERIESQKFDQYAQVLALIHKHSFPTHNNAGKKTYTVSVKDCTDFAMFDQQSGRRMSEKDIIRKIFGDALAKVADYDENLEQLFSHIAVSGRGVLTSALKQPGQNHQLAEQCFNELYITKIIEQVYQLDDLLDQSKKLRNFKQRIERMLSAVDSKLKFLDLVSDWKSEAKKVLQQLEIQALSLFDLRLETLLQKNYDGDYEAVMKQFRNDTLDDQLDIIVQFSTVYSQCGGDNDDIFKSALESLAVRMRNAEALASKRKSRRTKDLEKTKILHEQIQLLKEQVRDLIQQNQQTVEKTIEIQKQGESEKQQYLNKLHELETTIDADSKELTQIKQTNEQMHNKHKQRVQEIKKQIAKQQQELQDQKEKEYADQVKRQESKKKWEFLDVWGQSLAQNAGNLYLAYQSHKENGQNRQDAYKRQKYERKNKYMARIEGQMIHDDPDLKRFDNFKNAVENVGHNVREGAQAFAQALQGNRGSQHQPMVQANQVSSSNKFKIVNNIRISRSISNYNLRKDVPPQRDIQVQNKQEKRFVQEVAREGLNVVFNGARIVNDYHRIFTRAENGTSGPLYNHSGFDVSLLQQVKQEGGQNGEQASREQVLKQEKLQEEKKKSKELINSETLNSIQKYTRVIVELGIKAYFHLKGNMKK